MHSLLVVKLEVTRQSLPRGAGAIIFVQVHLLIFHGPPQALRKDVVQSTAFAVHTDLIRLCLQALQILRACEVAPLIAVADRRNSRPKKRTVKRGQNGRHLERLVEFPGQDVAAEPVQHGHQIQPALVQADIGEALLG